LKTTLEYVMSAPGQAFLPSNQDLSDDQFKAYRAGVIEATKLVNKHVREECTHYTPKLSMLFNAYTEKGILPLLGRLGKMGIRTVYADSGGLQMVTAGKAVTDEIKEEIYKVQAIADYAMCFDEIPLSSNNVPGKKRTRNERSNYSNKIYHPDGLHAAAKLTGRNVKAQIDAFNKMETDTKVVLIVQGNTWQDMQLFYNEIAKQLKGDDWNRVDGLAVADTCIGNGEFESIEMIRAAKHIGENAHPNVKKHLHILGVGSRKRMRPFVYLKRSGYLDNYQHISYDSSSHTSTFTYGLMKLDGGCKALGQGHGSVRTPLSLRVFEDIYNLFDDYLKKYVTLQQFHDIVHGPETHSFGEAPSWSHSEIKERAMASKDENHILIAHLIKPLYTYYQVKNFMTILNDLWDDYNEGPEEPMTQLLDITDDKQLLEWKNANSSNTKLKSKRIKRKDENVSLEGFL
jgi:hypothetical protein